MEWSALGGDTWSGVMHIFLNKFIKISVLMNNNLVRAERWRLHQLEQQTLSIFSQMYRYYLKHKSFDTYVLPPIVQTVYV